VELVSQSEAKAVEKLTNSHIKQVLNYLAAPKRRLGQLVQIREIRVSMILNS
jgi:hypothetical protein